jgi:hypothetical protein
MTTRVDPMLPNAQVPAFHAARLGPERWALRHGEDVVKLGRAGSPIDAASMGAQGGGSDQR